ncbi:MAG: hotdog fold thioesterase [Gemmatimonadaceae bacterium]
MSAPDASRAEFDEVATAIAVVTKMMATDTLAQWMGVETLEIAPRRSTIRMTVRSDMLNGAGGGHGGIVYSLADSAFSYATNGCGNVCVAVDCTVSYPAGVKPGDVITAVAVVESQSNRLQFCNVTVRNQDDVIVGHFRGTVYRTLKPHFPDGL